MGEQPKMPEDTNPQDIDAELEDQLVAATKSMSRASALIREGEAIKAGVKAEILPLMDSFDIKTYGINGLGTLGCKKGKGSGINAPLLRKVLLDEGMDADKIQPIIDKSTKSWSYTYVDFKAAK